MERFDCIVIGGGHAGVEAALIARRSGVRVALISPNPLTIGQMSCNPAIGGLGKGQLVKEVDALGGEMGRIIDDTGIQFRTLNESKGPAVRSSRAQADRTLYRERAQQAVSSAVGVTVLTGMAAAIELKANAVTGVRLEDGSLIPCRAVVVTTGTFLRGLMHTGECQSTGGRVGEKSSLTLSDSLAALGLRLGRLKTGTPPRISLKSINLEKLVQQPGEIPIRPFSFRTSAIHRPQICCYLTRTNERTHQLISENVERSPMFNGQIKSTGPRYCPSIEDKVFRFRDKSSHTIFLEPEGFHSDTVYPNGISTSLPADVQERFVRSIEGLEQAEILQLGYAVEYDYVDPTQLTSSLQVKGLEGLFLAGQINGTSGYEEAAGQGILAGINAAQYVKGFQPVTIGRDEGYIGVMVDDLITRGVSEPYRMFTSRAEYRLHLREDNADERLTPLARKLGLLFEEEWVAFEARRERIEREKGRFEGSLVKPTLDANSWLVSLGSSPIADTVSLSTLVRRPELTYAKIAEKYPIEIPLELREATRVETELKFVGYLRREQQEIAKLHKVEGVRLRSDLDFHQIHGLSIELREKLSRIRPETLGQAARISGVTPAAISVIAVHLRKLTDGSERASR